jgi:hypothetical protein
LTIVNEVSMLRAVGHLADLAPVSPQYASLPVAQAFDWASSSDDLAVGEWYLVVFRSVRRLDADDTILAAYDDRAHHEAESAPGFIHYFKGPVAPDRTCLSFCLWTDRAHARAAAGKAAHRDAVSVTTQMYDAYLLEFVRVRRPASTAPLEFSAYDAVPTDARGGQPLGLTGQPRPTWGTEPSPS